ncbi:MAG: hypothetical protein LBF93_06655 [Zoogloeaceae bacterium]|jgi:uncharacterized membrane protein|nr:hypothetical protein [Zoogloeaceae bacterium]
MTCIPARILRGILLEADGSPARMGISRRRINQILALACMTAGLAALIIFS